MRRFALLVVLWVVVSGVVGVAAARQETVTLTVEVVDGNGNPLSDATVNATWDGGSAVETTKSNGKALVDVPEGARVEIDVSHPHYARNFPYVIEDADARDVTIAVAQKASATVTTTNAAGEPISARVVLTADGREVTSGVSGEDGVFETGTVERGEYSLVVLRSGYYRNRTELDVVGDVNRTVAIEQGSVTVSVTVRDDHFSPPEPVANATVRVADIGSVKTLASGEATIQVPVNSRVGVTVTKPGYDETTTQFNVFEEPAQLNVTIQRTPAISLRPANDRVVVGETVRVEVTDEYGTPVEGAAVALDGQQVAETNAQGVATVPVESAGEHTLRASTGDLQSEPVAVLGVEPAAGETPTPTPEPTATPTETTSTALPGFTATAAVLAFLLSIPLLRRLR